MVRRAAKQCWRSPYVESPQKHQDHLLMSFGKVGLKPVADWSIALAFVDRVQLSGVSAEKPDETRQRMSCCHGDAWCGWEEELCDEIAIANWGTIGSSERSVILFLHVIRRRFRWYCLWNVVLIPGLSLSETLWSELSCRGAEMETVKTESDGCHCAYKLVWRPD